MRAIISSTHQFARQVFDQADSSPAHEWTYLSAQLEATTARPAEAHVAVIASLNDKPDAAGTWRTIRPSLKRLSLCKQVRRVRHGH